MSCIWKVIKVLFQNLRSLSYDSEVYFQVQYMQSSISKEAPKVQQYFINCRGCKLKQFVLSFVCMPWHSPDHWTPTTSTDVALLWIVREFISNLLEHMYLIVCSLRTLLTWETGWHFEFSVINITLGPISNRLQQILSILLSPVHDCGRKWI